jgi:hypothetical protein
LASGRYPRHRVPRLARVQLCETLGDDRQIGSGHRFVQAHEDVAGFHPVAVVCTHFADDAAGWVLHFFHIGIDNE